jgi:hypothetical protein
MTTYHVWFEGYRKNEDAAELVAGDEEDAVIKYCNQDWYDGEKSNCDKWLKEGRNVFCQALGDDKPKLLNVRVEVEPCFYVEEV